MKTFDEIYEELQSEDNGEFKEIIEDCPPIPYF